MQRPSIASVVASYDPDLSKYSTFVTLQMPRREIIENLKSMVKVGNNQPIYPHLFTTGTDNFTQRSFEVFGRQNNRMPAIVFYYRDGVSEGEYTDVLKTEGQAIEGEGILVI